MLGPGEKPGENLLGEVEKPGRICDAVTPRGPRRFLMLGAVLPVTCLLVRTQLSAAASGKRCARALLCKRHANGARFAAPVLRVRCPSPAHRLARNFPMRIPCQRRAESQHCTGTAGPPGASIRAPSPRSDTQPVLPTGRYCGSLADAPIQAHPVRSPVRSHFPLRGGMQHSCQPREGRLMLRQLVCNSCAGDAQLRGKMGSRALSMA